METGGALQKAKNTELGFQGSPGLQGPGGRCLWPNLPEPPQLQAPGNQEEGWPESNTGAPQTNGRVLLYAGPEEDTGTEGTGGGQLASRQESCPLRAVLPHSWTLLIRTVPRVPASPGWENKLCKLLGS